MRRKLFFKTFLISLSILLVTVFATLFSIRPLLNFRDLVDIENLFKVPMFMVMPVFIIGFSLVFSWVIYYNLTRIERNVVDRLHRLNIGNYNLDEQLDGSESSVLSRDGSSAIREEISQLRNKLVHLSREVQELSSAPQLIGKESKEEILENERHRIARELHDSVSQQLFAAMMMLSALNERSDTLPEKIQQSLRLVESIVNESQSEMRALLLHLRPVKLEGKTLKKGIEQLLNELKTKIQIKIKWEIMPIDTIPGVEDHLFRIIQELLSNTLRHAKAKTLEVYLTQNINEISLRVFDDGVGFDSQVKKAGSYGLANIQERVSGLGGTCKIISFPSQGTIVEIRIPNTMND